MRRNELKYGFYCQNPLVFVEYIFQFFINKALPGEEFHRHEMLNHLIEGIVMFNVSGSGAIDNALPFNARGSGIDSCR